MTKDSKQEMKLIRRYERLQKQLGTGSSRGDADIRDEMDEILKKLDAFGVPSFIFDDEAKAKTKKPKKVATVKGGGMIKKFSSGGAALRGFGKVIK